MFISLINNKRIHCVCNIWDVFFAILEAFILKIFRGSMPPDPPRTLAHAARAKNACGILLSPSPIAKMLRGPCILLNRVQEMHI